MYTPCFSCPFVSSLFCTALLQQINIRSRWWPTEHLFTPLSKRIWTETLHLKSDSINRIDMIKSRDHSISGGSKKDWSSTTGSSIHGSTQLNGSIGLDSILSVIDGEKSRGTMNASFFFWNRCWVNSLSTCLPMLPNITTICWLGWAIHSRSLRDTIIAFSQPLWQSPMHSSLPWYSFCRTLSGNRR